MHRGYVTRQDHRLYCWSSFKKTHPSGHLVHGTPPLPCSWKPRTCQVCAHFGGQWGAWPRCCCLEPSHTPPPRQCPHTPAWLQTLSTLLPLENEPQGTQIRLPPSLCDSGILSQVPDDSGFDCMTQRWLRKSQGWRKHQQCMFQPTLLHCWPGESRHCT